MGMAINRLLVANRGEIAVRIIRACRALGIESVAVFSEADRESLPVRMADRAVCIGPARSADSYLKVEALITTALGTGSDALHPGYGFLAEKPELADACAQHGITFVGPRADSIRQMGNKLLARSTVKQFGVPLVPGSDNVRDPGVAADRAQEVGFPVLLKAAAGGGGKGIKIVRQAGELQTAFETAAAEARAAFGDPTLYLERYIPNARHIEVQVIGDKFGTVVHLGERDCSLQRRYQKVVVEAPASCVPVELRERIREAGVAVARGIKYENAGTVEFIYDQDREDFFFLEMNTRIQVEHPVTEMITGLDLVREQIRVAGGDRLSFSQDAVVFRGHAIECRITAEAPWQGFRPCPGTLSEWRPPEGPGVRVDTQCFPGYEVPPFYDSLLAKLITCDVDREHAIARMKSAISDFTVAGIETTLPFLAAVMENPEYARGLVNTRWLESRLDDLATP
jgi:acetyl-CoA carboxylase biotin carboxylase subunit